VILDPGLPTQRTLGMHKLAAPGASVDFCTDRAGVASLSLRSVSAAAPQMLEVAVVYGSAPKPAKPRPAHTPTRQARQALGPVR
jgi:hypothetical protein